MSVIISPNMSLPVPVVGAEPGPQYATDINSCMGTIDGHNHVPGSGVQIPSSGLNINEDLPFNSNDATLLRSTRFISNVSPITASSPDVGCVYVSGADLYYNDTNGNQVRITQSGSVTGSTGTITGLPSGTASASYSSGTGTFTFLQATATAANMDFGTIVLRYPGSYPTPAGNYIAIQAPTSLATGYAFTLPASTPVSGGAFLTSSNAGVISYTNVDNSTLQVSGTTLQVKNKGITATQIADNTITLNQIAISATGTTAGVGDVAISASSGAFSTDSISYVDVTNLSVTITTVGNPVFILFSAVSQGSFQNGTGNGSCQLLRDASVVGSFLFSGAGGVFSPVTTFVDPVGAGTYVYKLQALTGSGGASPTEVNNIQMVVYER